MSYSPPASAKPFTLNIPDQDISEWRQLLHLSKLGPKTWENTQSEENLGVTYKWISETKDYWLNNYDWRAQEKHINSFPNYKMEIEGVDVHFAALFSEKKDAIPLIFMHGWPGSFIEFLPMCELIRNKYKPSELPYHVIVPSLPGYTLSRDSSQDRNWTKHDAARCMNQLMQNLGFGKYIAQGGDVGSVIGRTMAITYDSCVALHLNMLSSRHSPDPATLSPLEKAASDHTAKFRATGMAYAIEHGTRSATIGHVLSSNPLALLAWIGEKFLEWSDTTPPLDDILTNISLYWFTQSFPRSIYFYRHDFGGKPIPEDPFISTPTGFSFFPQELIPGFESVIKKHANLVMYRQHESGGHFAALEKPELLWGDVEEFVGKVWED